MFILFSIILIPLAVAVVVTMFSKAMSIDLAPHWGLFAGLFALITAVAAHMGV